MHASESVQSLSVHTSHSLDFEVELIFSDKMLEVGSNQLTKCCCLSSISISESG